jgi:hypothetical protein
VRGRRRAQGLKPNPNCRGKTLQNLSDPTLISRSGGWPSFIPKRVRLTLHQKVREGALLGSRRIGCRAGSRVGWPFFLLGRGRLTVRPAVREPGLLSCRIFRCRAGVVASVGRNRLGNRRQDRQQLVRERLQQISFCLQPPDLRVNLSYAGTCLDGSLFKRAVSQFSLPVGPGWSVAVQEGLSGPTNG